MDYLAKTAASYSKQWKSLKTTFTKNINQMILERLNLDIKIWLAIAWHNDIQIVIKAMISYYQFNF
jgi:hypothetical protein